ncbi:MAG: deoxyribonuclease IV [Patescibacteria group bacterium]|jgi:deoxyribonuclease-4
MKFGAHVSIEGGVWNAPGNAAKIGCEVLQMFTRPPQGGKASEITPETVKKFRTAMEENKISAAYVHAPYIINLASPLGHTRGYSIHLIREELERGSLLGCQAMMFHMGSAAGVGEKKGLEMAKDGVEKILKDYNGSCQLLIEMSAGAGAIMGDKFEDVWEVLQAKGGNKVGVCLDTQHAFASGYDFRTKEALEKTLKDFDDIIGLERLILIHTNDSATDFGSHKDRHAHIGEGKIGQAGFEAIINNKKLKGIDLILETPWDDGSKGVEKDLKLFKKIRG